VCLLDEVQATRDGPHLIEHRLEKVVLVLHHLRNRESRSWIVFKQLCSPDFTHCAFEGGVYGGFCGSLANLILTNAAAGSASGALTDVGINDHFMKELAATLIPGSSALFVLTRSPSPDRDRLLEELKGLGGRILMTSLSHEDEARLQAALSAAKSDGS
jgi:uncharacterized membrane protein